MTANVSVCVREGNLSNMSVWNWFKAQCFPRTRQKIEIRLLFRYPAPSCFPFPQFPLSLRYTCVAEHARVYRRRAPVFSFLLLFLRATNRFRIDSACGWHKPYLRFQFTFYFVKPALCVEENTHTCVLWLSHAAEHAKPIERVLQHLPLINAKRKDMNVSRARARGPTHRSNIEGRLFHVAIWFYLVPYEWYNADVYHRRNA